MQRHIAALEPCLAVIRQPESLIQAADRNLLSIISQNGIPNSIKDGGHASFLETPVGVASLVLARLVNTRSSETNSETTVNLRRYWSPSIALLKNAVKRVVAEDADERYLDDGDSEVLYGRAGLLYSFLFLRKAVEGAKAEGSFGSLGAEERSDIDRVIKDSNLNRLVGSIMKRGRLGAEVLAKRMRPEDPRPCLMWRWHGKAYLGGAHGVCEYQVGFSYLTTIRTHSQLESCKCCSAVPKIPSRNTSPKSFALLSGHLDSKTLQGTGQPKPHRGRMSHQQPLATSSSEYNGIYAPVCLTKSYTMLNRWCHGATAALILLSTVLIRQSPPHSYFTLPTSLEERIIQALHKGAILVYDRGLLRKGVGLCHGVGGSVYALLAASTILDALPTSHPQGGGGFLKRAMHLADLARLSGELERDGEMNPPDHPWSLYEGLAGMCCAWADVLSRWKESETGGVQAPAKRGSGMPGYDDLI